jgi:hypothetical protein
MLSSGLVMVGVDACVNAASKAGFEVDGAGYKILPAVTSTAYMAVVK